MKLMENPAYLADQVYGDGSCGLRRRARQPQDTADHASNAPGQKRTSDDRLALNSRRSGQVLRMSQIDPLQTIRGPLGGV